MEFTIDLFPFCLGEAEESEDVDVLAMATNIIQQDKLQIEEKVTTIEAKEIKAGPAVNPLLPVRQNVKAPELLNTDDFAGVPK